MIPLPNLNNSSRASKDDDKTPTRTPTVDELLQMLSNQNNIPPPVPPKPRANLNSTSDEFSFRKYYPSPTTQFQPATHNLYGSNSIASLLDDDADNNNQPIRPFVTECPEEADNNNIVSNSRNTSTVKILEVSSKNHSTYGNSNNPTLLKSQKGRLFHENNSYASPVITCATDDEDEDQSDADVPTGMEVDSILSESSKERPPRTSTPNTSYYDVKTRDENIDDDALNTSRETDELMNTSALNQSGGCELVGINDNSDTVINSKESPKASETGTKMSYSMKALNGSAISLPRSTCVIDHTDCHEKIKELENTTSSLMNYVEKLHSQIMNLSDRVEELQTQVSQQQTNQRKTPIKSNTSTTTRQPTQSVIQSKLSQSYSNSATRPLRKASTYASTNSLHADNVKTGRTSTSTSPPMSQYQTHRLIRSPSSTLNLSQRRDISTHTSMLSLNSLSYSNGSTLKKTSAVSGSISNLSQAPSQLVNWPSISDFITTKNSCKEVLYDEEDGVIRLVLYDRLITMRVPSWMKGTYNIDKVIEPPSIRLKLDWVHGYRGRDCRSNIYYLPTGECVYFVASIVVLFNPELKSQRHYLGHTDSVKCLAIHPNKLIIASGQSAVQNRRDKRPIVRVWNTVNLTTIRVIGFNEDFDRSICCLAFSKHDQGNTLAVVDESNEHTITLLDWQREKNWRLAETNSGHEAVLAIDFHPIDKYSLVAVGKCSVNFWDIRGMTLAKRAGLFDKYDKPKYVLCLTFNDFGDTITGDSNGSLIIWPRGSNRPKRVIHNLHQGGVFSVLAMKDGSYLTGGKDGRILELDDDFNSTGREFGLPEHCGGVRFITYARGSQVLVGTLRNSILLGSLDTNFQLIMQGHAEAISSLAIHPKLDQYLTGGFDDQIHLFDTKKHDIIWSKCLTMPATAAAFSPDGQLLIVGSTLGKWTVIDSILQETLFVNLEGCGTISCVKFSPDGQLFCMGSSDANLYIYKTSDAGSTFLKIGACVGHSSPIKEIDWSDDGRYLQSQSLNFELLYWKAHNCRPLEEVEIIDDLQWFTQNCTLGFNVLGLWEDSNDSALVSHCDKSNNGDLMVSVTDAGSINIFKWPPCYNQCLSQKYYGNVERLNYIKFLRDDSRIITIGAKNCVTTEWTYVVDRS